MPENAERIEELQQKISQLRVELQDQQKSLPAHSIRPHQLMAIEEMEDELRELEAELVKLQSEG